MAERGIKMKKVFLFAASLVSLFNMKTPSLKSENIKRGAVYTTMYGFTISESWQFVIEMVYGIQAQLVLSKHILSFCSFYD